MNPNITEKVPFIECAAQADEPAPDLQAGHISPH
jgi:hypothetical protein